jgi:hypothetical protein
MIGVPAVMNFFIWKSSQRGSRLGTARLQQPGMLSPNVGFLAGPVTRKFDAGTVPEDQRHLPQAVEGEDVAVGRRLGLFGHFPGTLFCSIRSADGVTKLNPYLAREAPVFTPGLFFCSQACPELVLFADAFEFRRVLLLGHELTGIFAALGKVLIAHHLCFQL